MVDPAGGLTMTPLITKPAGMGMAVNPLDVVKRLGGAQLTFCAGPALTLTVTPSPTTTRFDVAVAVLATRLVYYDPWVNRNPGTRAPLLRSRDRADTKSMRNINRGLVSGLFLFVTACGGEVLPAEPAVVGQEIAATPATDVSHGTTPSRHVDFRLPKAMDACVPCPAGAHVETVAGQPTCVQFGQGLGPAGCQDVAIAPLCASPGPNHTQHGTITNPLCMLDPTSADTRPQCYLCSPPEGCCDCLGGAASVVYCLTACCAGTL